MKKMIPKVFLPRQKRCCSRTLNIIATLDVSKILSNKSISSTHHLVMGKCSALWNASGRSKFAETIMSSGATTGGLRGLNPPPPRGKNENKSKNGKINK